MGHYDDDYEYEAEVFQQEKRKKYKNLHKQSQKLFNDLETVIQEMRPFDNDRQLLNDEVLKLRALFIYCLTRYED